MTAPGLPDEVWLEMDPDPPLTLDGWYLTERPDTVRYVRAEKGDVVIPAAVAKAYTQLFDLNPTSGVLRVLYDTIRAQQGGTS
jgi:hypothetical protein